MRGGAGVSDRNNFDLIRFVLASMVFVSHTHDLSGLAELAPLSALISSTFAVQAFFVISGFLIFQSFDRSVSIKSYAGKRVRRIYPAYFFVVTLCALALVGVSASSAESYTKDLGTWRYLIFNSIFLNFMAPSLPGVFTTNIVDAVNGALWTLKIEVAFYVAVPICVWLFSKIGRLQVLVGIYALSAVYGAILLSLAAGSDGGIYAELARQLPGQMTYFIAGAAIYYYSDRLPVRGLSMLTAGILLFVLSTFALEIVLRPMAVALCVMGLAFGPYLGRFGRFGDFSYGIYIVHFPILQTLITLGLPRYGAIPFLLVSVTLVMLIAVAMWHLIEKRFLKRSSHYRQEADATVSAEHPVKLQG